MEAQLVIVASSVGSAISLILLVDAWQDRRLVQEDHPDDDALCQLTEYRLRSEWFRFAVQMLFLLIAVAVLFGHEQLREIALLVLVAVPVVLAAWSIYAWVWRRRMLR